MTWIITKYLVTAAIIVAVTFWYVLPTLPMFLIFPIILKPFGFWPAMAASVLLTVLSLALVAWFVRFFGIELF